MKIFASIVILMMLTLVQPSQAQLSPACNTYVFPSTNLVNNTSFKSCVDLPVLNSYLHWTYIPSTDTLRIAYRHTGVSAAKPKWVAWAVNPTRHGMVGSQCFVAYQDPKDGSMVVYTSSISSYGTQLAKGELSFKVFELSALALKDEIIIFATLQVPRNATTLNQLWQEGPLSSDGTPMMHSVSGPNVRSMASLNLLSGVAETTTVSASGSSLKIIHGVLNTVSWGILMPMGIMAARYMHVFTSEAWFYLHIGCQVSAYFIGVAGWATGLILGSRSKGANHLLHRNIGITIFTLATFQMLLASLARPKKDHKYRTYWNICHRLVGCAIIVISFVNILQGFKILDSLDKWKYAYIGIIASLAAIAAILEVTKRRIESRRKDTEVTDNGAKLETRPPV